MIEEVWKEFIHKNKIYRVSYSGIIQKFINNKWESIKYYTSNRDYLMSIVGLVHRVVAIQHKPNPLNLPQVNHKDLNRYNCHGDNLEWCTAKYNTEHSITNGVKKTGVSLGSCNGQAVLDEDKVRQIRELFGKITSIAIAKRFNVSQATISGIKNNKFWKDI